MHLIFGVVAHLKAWIARGLYRHWPGQRASTFPETVAIRRRHYRTVSNSMPGCLKTLSIGPDTRAYSSIPVRYCMQPLIHQVVLSSHWMQSCCVLEKSRPSRGCLPQKVCSTVLFRHCQHQGQLCAIEQYDISHYDFTNTGVNIDVYIALSLSRNISFNARLAIK